MSMMQNHFFYMCGDFNERVFNLDDFIAGVDHIPERKVVDFSSNKHGELLCDSLIDSNCCILNGRNFRSTNFTFLGPQGASVVDYCIVPYENLNRFDNFEVILISDLMNSTEVLMRLMMLLANRITLF